MNETGNIEFDRKVAEATLHIRTLTEWAKINWLTRNDKPMQIIGIDDDARRDGELAQAVMWISILEAGWSTYDADMIILGGLWLSAFMIEGGLMDLEGEIIRG